MTLRSLVSRSWAGLAVLVVAGFAASPARATISIPLQAQLGNPSGATADAANHTHYLVPRAQYALDYNDTTREPNWVAWDLTTADVGSSGRSSSFFADTTLPAGFTIVGDSDYSGSGYDRGHMCPSGDRTVSRADNDVVFYMSNMIPQAPDNNQGVWNNFESYCRTLASAGNEVLIICGPSAFGGSKIASGVSIAGYTWKIVVVVPTGSGTALSRVTTATRVIAIRVPNIQGVRSTPWQTYVTSVAAIEVETGLTFFSALPTAVAASLRLVIDGQPTTGAPVITGQPTAQTAPVGGNATFAVTATGNATLTYQWAKDDTDLPGETEATLSLTNVQVGDAGNYSVTVTNSVGAVTSNAVALVLSGLPPTITTSPAASTVTAGSTATLTVVAGGSPTLTYQWRKGTVALANGGKISGATGPALTLVNAQAAEAGSYDVVVTNGNGVATSGAAVLTVTAAAPTIVTSPAAQAVTIGATATLTVTAKGSEPLSYQWRKGGSAVVNGGTISGATTASLVIANAQPADAGSYDVVVSNGQNPDATSAAVALTVSAAAGQLSYSGGSYTQNFDTLPGATGTFTLTGAGPISLTAAPINATGLAGWSIAKIGGTGANAVFNVGAGAVNTGSVYAFGTGTTAERSLGAVLSGAVASAWGLVLVNNTGQTITQFTVGYTGEQWRYGAGTVGGTDKIAFEYQVGGSDIATGTFTAVTGLDFTSRVNSATATGTAAALDGNAAANRAALSGTVTGLTWTNGQTLVLRWKDFDVAGSDDGLAIDDFTFTTNVGPVGAAPAVAATTPATGATAVNPATPITITFNQAVNTANGWFAINSTKNGAESAAVTGGPVTFTLSPPVSFPDNDTVSVTVFAAQVSDQVTGTLHPAADTTFTFTTQAPVAPVITTQPVAQTAAAGSSVSLTVVATGTAPIGYQWRRNGVAISGNGTASTAALTLANVQAADMGNYDVVVSNGVNPAATSTAVAVTVTPAAPTIVTPPIAQAVAVGANATFNVAASGTAPFTYQWRKGGVDLANGGAVAGATTATLTLTGVALTDAGNYDVVVSNGVGTPATSAAVALTVNAPSQATIAWDFTTAAPTSGLPAEFSGGVVTQGNNNGTTTLLTTTAASSGYTGFSAGNNAGAAARVGALSTTAGTGSAYFEFTLAPVAGKTVNATSLSFGSRSSGTGPLAYAVYTSVDNFTAPVAAGTLLANSTWSLQAPVVSPVTGAVSAAVTFRIYGYNGAGAAGVNNANWRIDDLKLGVNVGGGGATAPTITTPPVAQTVAVGANVTFTVVAGGSPTLTYQWRKNTVNLTDGATVAGATTATLTLANVQTADAGSYDVVVGNGAGGSATSAGAVLTVNAASGVPVIATPPVAAAAMAGGNVTLSVGATGTGPLSYQWKKDGTTIAGATGATLALTNLAASAGGSYTVVVTNAAGSATSVAVPLNVIVATQSVAGPGYVAGGTVTIVNTLGYGGTLAGYGWQLLLPAGWSYASGSGNAADTAPTAGATSLAEWQWTTNLGSPVIFTAKLNVPAGAVGAQTVSAIFLGKRTDGSTFQVLVQPDALTIHRSANFHHGDTNQDGSIGLTELTRLIELYNTRDGSVRTGKYHPKGGTEDGFAPGP